jgi:NADPH:quinone reductase-like Zn-dependent oxidoreductase
MKAVVLQAHGGPELLEYADAPDPRPGPGQVLIEVAAAAVNYADVIRRRDDPYPFPTPLPFVPGSEVAGTVAALGEGVDGPPVGTPVFALAGTDGSGGYAERAVAEARAVVPIPPGLDPERASALMVAGSTAMLALTAAARLVPGESVVVQGAAGGVGGFALQIARALGAQMVIGAASTRARREAARGRGASAVVDSSAPGWAAEVRALTGGAGADVVLEMGGGSSLAESVRALAPFGRCVVMGAAAGTPGTLSPEDQHALLYDPALNGSLLAFNVGAWFGLRPQEAASALHELIGLVLSGRVRVPVGHTLPLARAAEAHRLLEAREALGKIVLRP